MMIEKGQRDSKVLDAKMKKGPKAREFSGPQKLEKAGSKSFPERPERTSSTDTP